MPFLTLRFARSAFTGVWRAEGLTILFLAEVLAEMSLFVFPPVLLRAVCLVLAILHRMYHFVAGSTYVFGTTPQTSCSGLTSAQQRKYETHLAVGTRVSV